MQYQSEKEMRMVGPEFLDTSHGRRIAFHRTDGDGPGVVFLGGFKSDMEGSKALHLEAWARGAGRAYLRFDYSGHGQSSGAFEEGAIGDWAEDAAEALQSLTRGPQILVGSSMGGWIALLVARAQPERIAGLIGIAAAPDFTATMEAAFTDADMGEMASNGRVLQPSDYSDAPYVITERLIEDGKAHLLLDAPLPLPMPARFLQGTADTDVPVSVALKIIERAVGEDVQLTLVKGADHRFSTPTCLDMIVAAVEGITTRSTS